MRYISSSRISDNGHPGWNGALSSTDVEEGPGFDVRQAQIADFFRVKLVERFVDDGLRSDAVAG